MENLLAPDFQHNYELEASKQESGFLPYACHYDNQTILTKNGELLQTLKLVGFSHEMLGADFVELREVVREAIKKHIKDNKIAIWFNTIRSRKNIDPGGKYDKKFPHDCHLMWNNKNFWNDKYINELYITILYEGKRIKFNTTNMSEFIFSKKFARNHEQYLNEINEKLSIIVNNVMEVLSKYGVKKLGIIRAPNGIFSEHLRFFNKIITLEDKEVPLPAVDLSNYLMNNNISFSSNSLKVESAGKDSTHYGAIITLKEYHDVSSSFLDYLLQLPETMIISEEVDFIEYDKAARKFKYQDYILKISKDEEFRERIGLKKIIDNDEGLPTSYCSHQINIKLISDKLETLNDRLKRVITKLENVGLIGIREDLNMEHCFWAQLPGNFRYLRRKNQTSTSEIAAFASLHNFPAGRFNNIWGRALTLFRTVNGTPYFFNFHHEKNGNTFFVGPKESGKTTFINFLISESTKYEPNIFAVDYKNSSEIFYTSLGGNYINIGNNFSFNPFINYDKKNWLKKYFTNFFNIDISDEDFNKFENYEEFLIYIQENFPDIYEKSKSLEHIFTNNDKEIIDRNISCINLSDVYNKDKLLHDILISYYLYLAENFSLNEKPIILSLDNIDNILSNEMLFEQFKNLLKIAPTKNMIVIFGMNKITENVSEFIDLCATQIYLPDNEMNEYYAKLLKLSDNEFKTIRKMKILNRNFLFKQANDVIIAELNLTGLNKILNVLNANEEKIKIFRDMIEKDKDNWLENYYRAVQ